MHCIVMVSISGRRQHSTLPFTKSTLNCKESPQLLLYQGSSRQVEYSRTNTNFSCARELIIVQHDRILIELTQVKGGFHVRTDYSFDSAVFFEPLSAPCTFRYLYDEKGKYLS
jgi:hypothetical protein